MTVRRLAARDLVQVARTNLERLELLLFRTQLHRIRGRTLRTESLDRSNARDLAQVVRLLREVDVSPVRPSSTTQDVSIIYQLLFINKKHNILYTVYCVFHISRRNYVYQINRHRYRWHTAQFKT